MGRIFGTDGARGVANTEISCKLAMNIGRAAAMVISERIGRRPVFIIGKDTRISSDMLEAAVTAGLCSVGAEVVQAGVLPTPAVSFLIGQAGIDAGIMLSASHNTYEFNGIKIFGAGGFKLSDEQEFEIEEIILDKTKPYQIRWGWELGRISRAEELIEDYIDHLAGAVEGGLGQVIHVFVQQILRTADPSQLPAPADTVGQHFIQDDLLDFELLGIAELAAAGAEYFDAVEFVRVVGGGQHNTRVGVTLTDKIGHGGGWHNTRLVYIRPHRAQPGGDGGLQHIRGDARILADDEYRLMAQSFRHNHGRRPADIHSQLAADFGIGNAPRAVGSKYSSHFQAPSFAYQDIFNPFYEKNTRFVNNSFFFRHQ